MSMIKRVTVTLIGLGVLSVNAQEVQPNKLEQYMTEHGVKLLHKMPVEDLQGLNLDMYLTSHGVIYYDDEKQVLINGASPKKLVGNSVQDMERSVRVMLTEKFQGKVIAKATNERTKITVLTDITCGWCKKLHDELSQYLQAGVSVEFVLYSRAGLEAGSAKIMSSILNETNPLLALDQAFAGRYVTAAQTTAPALKNNQDVAQMLGATGTPVIFLADGTMIDRYIPAQLITQEMP